MLHKLLWVILKFATEDHGNNYCELATTISYGPLKVYAQYLHFEWKCVGVHFFNVARTVFYVVVNYNIGHPILLKSLLHGDA